MYEFDLPSAMCAITIVRKYTNSTRCVLVFWGIVQIYINLGSESSKAKM
jgi:hypothetical protein